MTFRFEGQQIEWVTEIAYGTQGAKELAATKLEHWVGEQLQHSRNSGYSDGYVAGVQQGSAECPYDCTICHAHEEEE